MILEALQESGGKKYLMEQASENPTAFMALVGKTLPREIKAEIAIGLSDRMRGLLGGSIASD